MFKSALLVLLAGAIFFGPSLTATLTDFLSAFTAEDYKESVSDETMLLLAVESFRGPWGDTLEGFMDITDGKVEGWKQIAAESVNYEYYSWTLWQNKYEETTYALACAGTDSPTDVVTFLPMMLSENYSKQMRDAMDSVRNIKNIIKTDINELYITGHSLGGYLAMFLGTEFVDSNMPEGKTGYTTTNLPISTTFGEKGKNLTLDKIHAVTFGSPGFYKTKIKFASDVAKIINKAGIPISNQMVEPPEWAVKKFSNDANQLYNANVKNYKNSFDPVANLFVKPSAFIHVGNTLNINVKSTDPRQALIEWALQLPLANVYYHGPWVYRDMIRSQAK